MSNDFYLKFYVQENRRHRGLLAYEWLLELGRRQGLRGGSAFRAIAGFGRHHRLREEHFFELAGEVPIEVGFLVSGEEANKLIEEFMLLANRTVAEFIGKPKDGKKP